MYLQLLFFTQSPCPHLSVWVDAVHVDPAGEPDRGRLVGIGVAALQPQAVHPVLVAGPRRTDDHPGPRLQVDIILSLQAPAEQENIHQEFLKLFHQFCVLPIPPHLAASGAVSWRVPTYHIIWILCTAKILPLLRLFLVLTETLAQSAQTLRITIPPTI